jgi:hypothetical protein
VIVKARAVILIDGRLIVANQGRRGRSELSLAGGARTLAKLLWTDELEAVWMPPEWIARPRRRLARRDQLVRARSRVKNEIHAVLMRCLKGVPPSLTSSGSRGGIGCGRWNCPLWRIRRSRPGCATSSFWTQRSSRSSG